VYHKIAPCPANAVRRGLYASPELFARQLAELRAAGFSSATMGEACIAEDNREKRIVLSFDDGFQNVLQHAPAPLAKNGFRAIQFLLPGRLGGWNEWDAPLGEAREKLMDAAQVRDWLAAGHEIGAHSMTHPDLTKIPVAQAREEIFASRKSLEDRFGVAVGHFCYPYGHSNETVRALVAEAGYCTACTTQRGVNTRGTPPLEIARWTARRASPRPKEVLARFLDAVFNDKARTKSPA
ncbi:MAG TPA: polysaccharide deacetylase family protein, partial [Chthoniobacteraceae bacterium]|nr:polysaccharide deacetylase family protein [Chthoniobacteraceae bacterium]